MSALLARWGIRVNDSGGTPLSVTPVGGFLIDMLKAAAPHAGPVDRLSLFKHPLAAFGLDIAECRSRARRIEIDIWRAQKPDAKTAEARKALDEFRQLQPLGKLDKPLPLAERLKAHIALAEQIAATAGEKGADRLWRGPEGEKAAESGSTTGRMPRMGFRRLRARTTSSFSPASRAVIVGPTGACILGSISTGRLKRGSSIADLMILGGLNEGVWPSEARADPWMSRPMKKSSACLCPSGASAFRRMISCNWRARRKSCLRARRRIEGAPSVPSRFLLQLDAVLRAVGYPDALVASDPWQAWAQALDAPPESEIVPCAPPEPRPAADKRPKQLSVTEIATWRRNPYAIYARRILGLKKLDPLEPDVDAADRGSVIHEVLDAFMKKHPESLPEKALDDFSRSAAALSQSMRSTPRSKPSGGRVLRLSRNGSSKPSANGAQAASSCQRPKPKERLNSALSRCAAAPTASTACPTAHSRSPITKPAACRQRKRSRPVSNRNLPLLALIAAGGRFRQNTRGGGFPARLSGN